MKRLSLSNERGQSMVLMLVFVTVLIAIAGAVVDVGSWYRTHRTMQATADASALAGAQELPDSPGNAIAHALDYAKRNQGGVTGSDIEITGVNNPNDTIKVTARTAAPGVFTRLMGIDSVTARASAKARVGSMGSAKWAAPIGVDYLHDDLHCVKGPPLSCNPEFNKATEITFDKTGPGAFRLLNIDQSYGGTGPEDIAEWIRNGLEGYMPVDRWYYSDPGIKPNSSHVRDALTERIGIGKEILIPIYSDTRAQGAGFEYYVIGWVGWVTTSFEIRGVKDVTIFGHFTQIIWEGIQSTSGNDDGTGARAVSLIE
jgi:Putative Flp pilus-assembly TadE/G-like